MKYEIYDICEKNVGVVIGKIYYLDLSVVTRYQIESTIDEEVPLRIVMNKNLNLPNIYTGRAYLTFVNNIMKNKNSIFFSISLHILKFSRNLQMLAFCYHCPLQLHLSSR
jgi:hypothetical protein